MSNLEDTSDNYDPYTSLINNDGNDPDPILFHSQTVQHWWTYLSQLLCSQYFGVCSGLVVLSIFPWTFYIYAFLNHGIYVPNMASQHMVWAHPKTVSFIVTPIATAFAITTTYFFTKCVRFAMQKYLTPKTKLESRAFIGWSAVANKHPIIHQRSRWTIIAMLSAGLLATLTTGFTAVFTPQLLLINKPLPPFQELDMNSSAFLGNYTTIAPPCTFGNYTFFSCSKSGQPKPLMLLEAGESAAFQDLNYSTTTNFFQTSFAGTSGGVMPLGGYPFAIWFANDTFQPNYYHYLPENYAEYLGYNVTYRQRGLTAKVTCTMQQSSPLAYTEATSIDNPNSSIITPTVTCGNASASPLPQQIVGADFLLAAVCSLANQTQYIHLRGQGVYAVNPADGSPLIANMTCQLDPIFTTNDVLFWDDALTVYVSITSNTTSFPAVLNTNTTLIKDITAALTQTLLDGHSQYGNAFVDFIQDLVDAYPAIAPPHEILESMFRGMFEISGLSVNGYWSSKLFENGPPEGSFGRNVAGNVTYNLYGWDGDVRAAAGLIPFTIVVTIAFLLLAWSWDGGKCLHPNPIDPLSIIVATSASDFDWMSGVDIEIDDIPSLSTGFKCQKVDGRWVLTGLSPSLEEK